MLLALLWSTVLPRRKSTLANEMAKIEKSFYSPISVYNPRRNMSKGLEFASIKPVEHEVPLLSPRISPPKLQHVQVLTQRNTAPLTSSWTTKTLDNFGLNYDFLSFFHFLALINGEFNRKTESPIFSFFFRFFLFLYRWVVVQVRWELYPFNVWGR